jgi:hypothetical protein
MGGQEPIEEVHRTLAFVEAVVATGIDDGSTSRL